LSAETFYLIIDNFNTRYIKVNLFYQAFTHPVAETSSQSVSNYWICSSSAVAVYNYFYYIQVWLWVNLVTNPHGIAYY